MGDYQHFIDKFKGKTGIDLSLYKEGQMKRRLTSLREKRGFQTFAQYYEAVIKDKLLFDELLDRMTINVSEFFRNQGRWEILDRKILPQLMEENRRIKVWSAACSTGEEPYSLAMILEKRGLLDRVDILATDLDEAILQRAKEGLYAGRSLKDVSDSVVKANFMKDEYGYRINPRLQKNIRFKKHNLLSDPFEKNFDLIICRNVMIYFTEEAKDKLYNSFSRSLRPGGILFVGSTEQIFNPQKYNFVSDDTFFYRKV